MNSKDQKWRENLAQKLIHKHGTAQKAVDALQRDLTATRTRFFRKAKIKITQEDWPTRLRAIKTIVRFTCGSPVERGKSLKNERKSVTSCARALKAPIS